MAIRKKSDVENEIVEISECKEVLTSTLSNYENALTIVNSGTAYIVKAPSEEDFVYEPENAKLYYIDAETKEKKSVAVLRDLSDTKKDFSEADLVKDIDFQLIRALYSIMFKAIQVNKKIGHSVTLYIPDLAEYLGIRLDTKEKINNFIKRLRKLYNVCGFVDSTRFPNRDWQSIYQIFIFENYDINKNTITISLPYFRSIIEVMLKECVVKDRNNKPKLDRNNNKLQLPINSYLVKNSILKQRNKNAVENVFIICSTIERAGGKGAHISVNTILKRNIPLSVELEYAKKNRNATRLMMACFKKTLELLKTETRLFEVYKNFEIVSFEIPTMKNYKDIVFEFKHNGKIKKNTI